MINLSYLWLTKMTNTLHDELDFISSQLKICFQSWNVRPVRPIGRACCWDMSLVISIIWTIIWEEMVLKIFMKYHTGYHIKYYTKLCLYDHGTTQSAIKVSQSTIF